MEEKQAVEQTLSDSTLYEDHRKREMMETLDRQKELAREESDLTNEWDQLSAQIEDI